MEVINPQGTTALREDKQLLVITHLSQLLTFITGFGGLIVPLILWLTNKDKVKGMDKHGKEIVNFQLSLILYFIICIPLILLLGLGILGFIFLGFIGLVFPIINAIKANNQEKTDYFITIRFF
ncbi:MAG: tRNA modification GTPase [Flavobacteriaceae bacterium CG2_30_34_30]|nr:DUF4870 domain-containing protein [Flavobacteriia bacterium]OIP49649.1 MAG: tRNA modification GTPase [Flavobacteriaceae bacterium CG2_30_34_30]PIQ19158.1 MAG: tRNA modification GTPase [Flavobacteriaceae bacterium CG18_big_fil_WC_8_21_14_2_50_34_36]PIV48385.1 MAG: DUF4870 domain-containing protein [Flavobacteriaceae bacterium CG02_land_8_20_14_3_00_34_13]PIZ09015.1 MAG: DUF4870 domain-containing protein [Flavobacteriaceae bacterium CG_4_10_14_0_8_um_filter_34_31]